MTDSPSVTREQVDEAVDNYRDSCDGSDWDERIAARTALDEMLTAREREVRASALEDAAGVLDEPEWVAVWLKARAARLAAREKDQAVTDSPSVTREQVERARMGLDRTIEMYREAKGCDELSAWSKRLNTALTAYEREVRASALEDAAKEYMHQTLGSGQACALWLHERVARIRAGEE